MKYLSIITTILLIFLVACGKINVKNENLPEGMKSGYWAGTRGDADYYNVGLLFFKNEYFTDGEGEFGTYMLMEDNTILLRTADWSERITVAMAKSGERLVLSDNKNDDAVVELIIPDTSSNSVKKDIKGVWEEYYELAALGDKNGSGYLWEFKDDGNIIISDVGSGQVENGTYEFIGKAGETYGSIEFIGDTIVIKLDSGEEWGATIFSLGDLLYLVDLDGQNGIFLLRQ